ncbi:glycosyltransferase family 2 protein [Rubrolithibacter danxiaensis]|uniref:glycosyltransferase family 2 protein n=1 Tax=Rubrolithibacter danxiaensis TaxID=3390805 RepID=UPI003BF8C85D
MNIPVTSLIISTYNWPQALELCLISVLNQSVFPAEVIIADDGSGEETRQLIKKYEPAFKIPLKHIWHEDIGFRKTIILNKAIAESSSAYIVQIDGDVILDKNFISDHVTSAEKNTFIRGTRAMLTPEKTKELIAKKSYAISPFSSGVRNRNNAIRIFSLRSLGSRKEMSSRNVRGSNLSFWKKDFELVNGYNNDLTGWGHEDEELAARFINNGIIKKIIKLCAIQFHLFHPVCAQEKETEHRFEIERVIDEKVQICLNGYRTLSN